MSALATKYNAYPEHIQPITTQLRAQFLDVAKQHGLHVEECLKWGEPSFLVNGGSTVRFDWKSKNPSYIGIYFNCNTRLVDTFKQRYGDLFEYQGNRAIMLNIDNEIPWPELTRCILLSYQYHSIKHLPLLGL